MKKVSEADVVVKYEMSEDLLVEPTTANADFICVVCANVLDEPLECNTCRNLIDKKCLDNWVQDCSKKGRPLTCPISNCAPFSQGKVSHIIRN